MTCELQCKLKAFIQWISYLLPSVGRMYDRLWEGTHSHRHCTSAHTSQASLDCQIWSKCRLTSCVCSSVGDESSYHTHLCTYLKVATESRTTSQFFEHQILYLYYHFLSLWRKRLEITCTCNAENTAAKFANMCLQMHFHSIHYVLPFQKRFIIVYCRILNSWYSLASETVPKCPRQEGRAGKGQSRVHSN